MRDTALTLAASSLILCGSVSAAPRALCGGGAEVPIDAARYGRPYVHMRLGAVSGAFLIDTGSSFSSIDAATYGQAPGSRVSATGSSLPTVARGDDLHAADLSAQPGPSRTTGIIGTDFLSTRTTEFHYDTDTPYLVISEAPCHPPDGTLLRFDETGFFGPPWRGRPLDANVPAAFLRIGSVRFRAWIDTGFFENVPGRPGGTVKANPTLMATLRAAGIQLKPEGSVASVTCDGSTHLDPVYRADAAISEDGASGQSGLVEPLIQSVSPDRCGGPGDHDGALGMVGVAWLARWKVLILDPLNGAVWIKKPEPPQEKEKAVMDRGVNDR